VSSSGLHDPSVLDALDMCGLSVSANGDWHSESGVRAKRREELAASGLSHDEITELFDREADGA